MLSQTSFPSPCLASPPFSQVTGLEGRLCGQWGEVWPDLGCEIGIHQVPIYQPSHPLSALQSRSPPLCYSESRVLIHLLNYEASSEWLSKFDHL